jgi:hypothetical protein
MKPHFLKILSLLTAVGTCYAAPIQFTAILLGVNEVPPVVTPGTGSAVVFYDPVAHTLQVNAAFSNLVGTTTASHIHAPAPAGVNAGVVSQTPSFTGFPLGVTSGTYNSAVFDLTQANSFNPAFITAQGGSVAAAEAAFASYLLSGNAYFNIHTTFAGGGEIRGQLAAVGVPDTGTTALLMLPAVFGLIGLYHRRRKGFSN